jgi:hypothetical protein
MVTSSSLQLYFDEADVTMPKLLHNKELCDLLFKQPYRKKVTMFAFTASAGPLFVKPLLDQLRERCFRGNEPRFELLPAPRGAPSQDNNYQGISGNFHVITPRQKQQPDKAALDLFQEAFK